MNLLARYASPEVFKDTPTDAQSSDIRAFQTQWKERSGRYMAVANTTGLTACLIAAIHWREASGDFKTYLHNGDPLEDANGNPVATVHEPAGILCHSWEEAAVDALTREKGAWAASKDASGLSAMCIFAECYNGLGYAERGCASPYVLAGTTGYVQGKFVGDGKFDAHAIDGQTGVLPLIRSIFPKILL